MHFLAAQDLQRLFAVARQQSPKPAGLEDEAQRLAEIEIVVGDQDRRQNRHLRQLAVALAAGEATAWNCRRHWRQAKHCNSSTAVRTPRRPGDSPAVAKWLYRGALFIVIRRSGKDELGQKMPLRVNFECCQLGSLGRSARRWHGHPVADASTAKCSRAATSWQIARIEAMDGSASCPKDFVRARIAWTRQSDRRRHGQPIASSRLEHPMLIVFAPLPRDGFADESLVRLVGVLARERQ